MSNLNNSTPRFFAKYQTAYRQGAAHAFVLHGNVTDYVNDAAMRIPQYMNSKMTASAVDCTVWYSPANGLDFPTNADRESFMRFAGLQTAGSDSNILAQMTGGSAPKPQLPKEPAVVFGLLDRALRTEVQVQSAPDEIAEHGDTRFPRIAVFVAYADFTMPNSELARMTSGDRAMLAGMLEWARDVRIGARENRIFLICESMAEISDRLRAHSSGYMPIEIRMPDYNERLSFIVASLDRYSCESTVTPEYFAQHAAGLSRFGIESIILASISDELPLSAELIQSRKREIIQNEFRGLLSVMDGCKFSDVGGNEKVKDMFRRSLLTPMSRGHLFRVPKGFLGMGPAGTGKTHLFRAVAGEGQFPMLEFHLGNLRGKYVGESEKNLDRVLSLLEALAPVGVFIDEIDQVIKRPEGNDGNSGVGANEFARLTAFMSDDAHKGRIIFFGATNRADLLDAATKRMGRFDEKFIVDVPTSTERKDMLTLMLRKQAEKFGYEIASFETATMSMAIDNAVLNTVDYTGAELFKIAEMTMGRLYDGMSETMAEALDSAVADFIPTTSDVARMRMLSLREVNDRSMLPDDINVADVHKRDDDSGDDDDAPVIRKTRRA